MIIIGAGGHAKVVIELWRALGIEPRGVLAEDGPEAVLGVPRLGTPALAARLRAEGLDQACIAIGDNTARARLGATLRALGYTLPAAVHPGAILSPSATLDAGCVVMPRAAIGPDARLAPLALANTGAIIEHDCTIEDAAHIAPGATLGGQVHIGARSLVGINAAIRPGITIGDDATVAAGAAVIRDVAPGTTVAGVPARVLR